MDIILVDSEVKYYKENESNVKTAQMSINNMIAYGVKFSSSSVSLGTFWTTIWYIGDNSSKINSNYIVKIEIASENSNLFEMIKTFAK